MLRKKSIFRFPSSLDIISPIFSRLANKLVANGADGLVLFNRYYRPDIDIDTQKVISENHMSSPDEIHIPMRWIGLLKGNDIDCDIAASTGVHDYQGAIKQILAGADAVQLCSALYLKGIPYIKTMIGRNGKLDGEKPVCFDRCF